MWLLCDDALVSCPQRDTIQTVSSSALLQGSVGPSPAFWKKRRQRSATFASHVHSDVQAADLLYVGSCQQAPKALAWQSEVVN